MARIRDATEADAEVLCAPERATAETPGLLSSRPEGLQTCGGPASRDRSRSGAKPPRGALLAATLLATAAALGAFAWLNLAPRPHPGFQDLRNPLAEPWSPDPRTERGWPFTAHRRFERPSAVNARGVWDGLGLALDAGLVLIALGGVWLPFALRRWRR